MGAKYTPSVKDQKANQRFQQKQLGSSKFFKSTSARPAKKKAK